MALKLDTIDLPHGLTWSDRYSWTPIVQNVTVTITGSVVVQEAKQLSGRPITLKGGLDVCWTTKSVVDALYAKTQDASSVMTLDLTDLGAGSRQVLWRRDQEPMEVVPLVTSPDENDNTLYAILTLRFIEVG